MTTRDLLGELRYHGETDPWCRAAVAEIERLRAALKEIVTSDTHSDTSCTWVGPHGRRAKRALGIYGVDEQAT